MKQSTLSSSYGRDTDSDQVLKLAIEFAVHAGRKTLTTIDVVYALKRLGRTLYGFGDLVWPSASSPSQKNKVKERRLAQETERRQALANIIEQGDQLQQRMKIEVY